MRLPVPRRSIAVDSMLLDLFRALVEAMDDALVKMDNAIILSPYRTCQPGSSHMY
jgi:hypothetical protein